MNIQSKHLCLALATLALGACSSTAQPAAEATTDKNAAGMTAPAGHEHKEESSPVTIVTAAERLADAPEGPCLTPTDANTLGADFRTLHADSGAHNHTAKSEGDWIYWRIPTRTAFEFPERDLAEMWVRTNDKDVSFERWFLEDMRSVEYMAGDLRTLGRKTTWDEVKDPVSQSQLDRLSVREKGKWRCQDAVAYSGKVGDVRWEVVWLPGLELPASVVRAQGPRVHQYELTGLRKADESQAFFGQRTKLDRMDFADIGDNESDPFVRKVINEGLVEHADHQGH